MIEYYNEDYMSGMKRYPDKYFSLCICDPPDGIGESGKTNKTRGKLAVAKDYKPFHGNDLKSPDVEYFQELMRVSKNQIIWGANHYISKIPYDSSCWVVWDKQNEGTDFADCELAWTSFKTAVRKFDFRWNGMLQGDMKSKEERFHPTQKPVALYKWLLTNYAKEGDLILDTHVGSASSLIACHDLGFDAVGFELDPDYYKASKERLESIQKQVTITDWMGGQVD